MLNFREPNVLQSLLRSPLMSLSTIAVRTLDHIFPQATDEETRQSGQGTNALTNQFDPMNARNPLDAEMIARGKRTPTDDDKMLMRLFENMKM